MPVPAGGGDDSTLPEWAPTGQDVADYVPWRTLTRAESSTVESDDTYQAMFSPTTRPDDAQVGRLIGNAVARVLARVGALDDSLQAAARTIVCLLTGSWIERSWPEDQDAQTRADALEKQAETMLAELAAANEVAGGTGDYGLEIVNPVWSFPAADCRWDNPTYW
jgi:hypothetical protein